MNPEFKKKIKEAVAYFRKYSQKEIGLLCHNDSDGCCSAAILLKAMERENIKPHLHIFNYTGSDKIKAIPGKDYNFWIFADTGASDIELFSKAYPDSKFLVLDHHPLVNSKTEGDNFFNPNPNAYGENGSEGICGATFSFLFAYELNKKNIDLIDIALTGAVGDAQRKSGDFIGVNKELETLAVKEGFVKKEELKVKPNIIFFDQPVKDYLIFPNSKFKGLDCADVISAWINSCTRMGKSELAVQLAQGKKDAYRAAEKWVRKYQVMLDKALKAYYENENNPEVVIKLKKGIIFLAQKFVRPNLKSTVSSILSFSIKDSDKVLILITEGDKNITISTRKIGVGDSIIDLGRLCGEAAKLFHGEGGGHRNASAVIIPKNKLEEFLAFLKERLI